MTARGFSAKAARKIWGPLNAACAVATFIAAVVLVSWGPQATTFRTKDVASQIESEHEIESLRSECRDLAGKMGFAEHAADAFSGMAILYLFAVFIVSAMNVRFIKGIENEDRSGPTK